MTSSVMKIILTKQKHWAFGAWSSAWLQSIRFNLISSAMDIAYTPDSLITSFSFVVFENDANHTPGKASRKTAVSVLILIGFACIPRHAPTSPPAFGEPTIYLLIASVLLQHNHGTSLALHVDHFSLKVCLDTSMCWCVVDCLSSTPSEKRDLCFQE